MDLRIATGAAGPLDTAVACRAYALQAVAFGTPVGTGMATRYPPDERADLVGRAVFDRLPFALAERIGRAIFAHTRAMSEGVTPQRVGAAVVSCTSVLRRNWLLGATRLGAKMLALVTAGSFGTGTANPILRGVGGGEKRQGYRGKLLGVNSPFEDVRRAPILNFSGWHEVFRFPCGRILGGGSLIFEWRWQNVLVLEKLFDFWAKISCSPKSPSSVSSHQSFDHQFKEVLCNLQNWPDAAMQQEN